MGYYWDPKIANWVKSEYELIDGKLVLVEGSSQPTIGSPITIRMMENRRMQCKDIPDEAFLDAVRKTPGYGGGTDPYKDWRSRFDVQTVLEETLGPIPEKLFLAKAAKLMAAKKLGGCECGCRGDYHIWCNRPHCCLYVDQLPEED